MIRLLAFLLFMVCGTALLYLVFVHELPRVEEEAGLLQPAADLALQRIHVKQNRGQALEWEAFADSAIYNEALRQAWLTTVQFHLYSVDSDTPRHIRGVADSAFVDDIRRRVLLRGSVRIVQDPETEVRADAIDYYTADGLVNARGNVQVRDRGSHVTGDSLSYNIRAERVIVNMPKLYQ
jgi:LPS export ABC transporter protein LptC